MVWESARFTASIILHSLSKIVIHFQSQSSRNICHALRARFLRQCNERASKWAMMPLWTLENSVMLDSSIAKELVEFAHLVFCNFMEMCRNLPLSLIVARDISWQAIRAMATSASDITVYLLHCAVETLSMCVNSEYSSSPLEMRWVAFLSSLSSSLYKASAIDKI